MITDQTPKNEEREVYASSLCQRSIYTQVNRTKEAYNVYTHFHRRKSTYMLGNQVFYPRYWSKVFGPGYLVIGIDPRYLVQGIGPKWFWSKVLRKA